MSLAENLSMTSNRVEEVGSIFNALALAEEAVRLNEPLALADPASSAGRLHAVLLKDVERLRHKCEEAGAPAA